MRAAIFLFSLALNNAYNRQTFCMWLAKILNTLRMWKESREIELDSIPLSNFEIFTFNNNHRNHIRNSTNSGNIWTNNLFNLFHDFHRIKATSSGGGWGLQTFTCLSQLFPHGKIGNNFFLAFLGTGKNFNNNWTPLESTWDDFYSRFEQWKSTS